MTGTYPILPDRVRSSLRAYLLFVPAPLREAVLEDDIIRDAAGLGAKGFIKLGTRWASVDGLHAIARAAVDGTATPELRDRDGVLVPAEVEWLEPDQEAFASLVIRVGEVACRFKHARLLSTDHAARRSALDGALRELTLLSSVEDHLREVVDTRPLGNVDYLVAVSELEAAPETYLSSLACRFARREPLGFDDVVPGEPATLAAIVGERRGETDLSAFVHGSHNEVRQRAVSRLGPARALAFFGPAYVAPSLSLRSLAADLASDVVVAVARKLTSAGDPFSALAALDLCANHLSGDDGECTPVATVGAEVIDYLFGDPERTEAIFERFAAAAFAALGTMERRATFNAEPLFYRRLVALTWAGHAARAMTAAGALDHAQLLGTALRACGNDVLVQCWRQRREAPHWRPEWLDPKTLMAYALARAHHLVAAAGDHASASWQTALATAADGAVKAGLGLQLLQPGPLDEFSSDWGGLPGLAPADTDHLHAAVAPTRQPRRPHSIASRASSMGRSTDPEEGAPPELMLLAYAFDAPTNADRERLADALSTRVHDCDSAGEETRTHKIGLDAALHLSGRWRHVGLAGAVFRSSVSAARLLNRRDAEGPRLSGTELVRLVLDYAAAVAPDDAAAWVERLKDALEQLAFGVDLTPEQAGPLLAAITILCRHDRVLSSNLARARHALSLRL